MIPLSLDRRELFFGELTLLLPRNRGNRTLVQMACERFSCFHCYGSKINSCKALRALVAHLAIRRILKPNRQSEFWDRDVRSCWMR